MNNISVTKELIERWHPEFDLVMPSEIISKYPVMKDFIYWLNFYGNKTVCLRFKEKTDRYRIRLFTDKYDYAIDIDSPREGETDPYIGCVYSCRQELPMETWTRGGDLTDGYGNESLNKIILDIISNEAETVKIDGYTEDKIKNIEKEDE